MSSQATLKDFNSDDSEADKDYDCSSSSDSEIDYKQKRNLITLQELFDDGISNGPQDFTHDRVECDGIGPFIEPKNLEPNQPLSNVVTDFGTSQTPKITTGSSRRVGCKKSLRKRNEEYWKKNVTKKARLLGKSYLAKNKVVEARSLKPACTCRAKCYENLSEEVRQTLFNKFWSSCNSWEQRRQYVADRVTKTVKVSKRVNSSFEDDKRKFNYNYTLKVNDDIVRVCKVMFLNTLSIGERYVKITVDKNERGITGKDRRGRHVPSNKTNATIVQSVIDHIASYPSYEIHSTGEQSKRRYLGPELSIALMFRQYKEKMVEAGKTDEEQAKKWLYRNIFNTKFNLSFKLPDVDE